MSDTALRALTLPPSPMKYEHAIQSGLPLSAYARHGVDIEYVNPRETVCPDDHPAYINILRIMQYSEKWVRAINRAVGTGKFHYPRLHPPVVWTIDEDARDDEEAIDESISFSQASFDGQHRSAAAALHTTILPVIHVENPDTIKLLAAMDKKGIFNWPYTSATKQNGYEYRANLMNMALDERGRDTPNLIVYLMDTQLARLEKATGGPLSPNLDFSDVTLRYCVGRVAFQAYLGRAEWLHEHINSDEGFWENNMTEELHKQETAAKISANKKRIKEQDAAKRIEEIVRRSGLPRKAHGRIASEALSFLTRVPV